MSWVATTVAGLSEPVTITVAPALGFCVLSYTVPKMVPEGGAPTLMMTVSPLFTRTPSATPVVPSGRAALTRRMTSASMTLSDGFALETSSVS